MLIDTHAHIYLDAFSADIDAVMQQALAQEIKYILLPNIDSTTIEDLNRLCYEYPTTCRPMMGLHPGSVKADYEEELALIRRHLLKDKYIAVGEIGIDLYWDRTFIDEQKEAFRIQIKWAKELELPVVIHARDSFQEIFDVLEPELDEGLRGVFHCFTGSPKDVERILNYGSFYFGLGGVVTFKNSGLSETVKAIPLDKIVLETDAPYLAPVPYRGKRNQPAYLTEVARKIAEIKNLSLDDIIRQTGNNAVSMFKLK